MVAKTLKPTFSQSFKARSGYLWRGIWTSALIGASLPAVSFYKITDEWPFQFFGSGGAKRNLIDGMSILLFPMIVITMLSGGLIGGLVGVLKGLYQSVTRQPIKEVKSESFKAALEDIEQDPEKSRKVINAIINDYEAKKGIHSEISKRLIKSLKTKPADKERFDDLREYLFIYEGTRIPNGYCGKNRYDEFHFTSHMEGHKPNYAADNRGKRLYNVIYYNVLAAEKYSTTPEKAEIRKNVRLLAQAKRTGHPLFSKLPREILTFIATKENSSVPPDEAIKIANTTYDSWQH